MNKFIITIDSKSPQQRNLLSQSMLNSKLAEAEIPTNTQLDRANLSPSVNLTQSIALENRGCFSQQSLRPKPQSSVVIESHTRLRSSFGGGLLNF